MERLLTVEELSNMLRVSMSTVYRWVHCDFVPHIKVGGLVRFNEQSVMKWLRAREQKGRVRFNLDIEAFSRD